ncbi:DJ-1/PfpI family protein [Nannocystis sp. SCPEA4]|uniref:DJ-1/PfpI family protein n=1 Tax=Nannocystis sp. SCPEA4 TaxID=2996787 RepID=UPI002270DCB9|nr:DJ-1/PfpI family protein [Nannocystis sp. SCPEA4]MCY1063097.1 DJ-1/PfpI family protein [Nannocystis sp. SCPEA4]
MTSEPTFSRPTEPFSVAMLLYPGFTLLDLIGPHQVLSGSAKVHLVAKTLAPVASDSAAQLVPTCTLEDCPRDVDVLFVPGGTGTFAAMQDKELLAFLADRGARAGHVTSVCTGSLILAAAGLLAGYRAATHWSTYEVLAAFGVEGVRERVVVDRNRVSGGGVTAGIDFGLTLLARLRGEQVAKLTQLVLEYDPAPPFRAGTPEQAGPELTAQAQALLAGLMTPPLEANPARAGG